MKIYVLAFSMIKGYKNKDNEEDNEVSIVEGDDVAALTATSEHHRNESNIAEASISSNNNNNKNAENLNPIDFRYFHDM